MRLPRHMGAAVGPESRAWFEIPDPSGANRGAACGSPSKSACLGQPLGCLGHAAPAAPAAAPAPCAYADDEIGVRPGSLAGRRRREALGSWPGNCSRPTAARPARPARPRRRRRQRPCPPAQACPPRRPTQTVSRSGRRSSSGLAGDCTMVGARTRPSAPARNAAPRRPRRSTARGSRRRRGRTVARATRSTRGVLYKLPTLAQPMPEGLLSTLARTSPATICSPSRTRRQSRRRSTAPAARTAARVRGDVAAGGSRARRPAGGHGHRRDRDIVMHSGSDVTVTTTGRPLALARARARRRCRIRTDRFEHG